MIRDSQKECLTCCGIFPSEHFFSIGDCGHDFCKECCVAHIEAKLEQYSEVTCMDNKCEKKLSPDKKIFSQLSSDIKTKYRRNELAMKIQKDPNLKPCQKLNCHGFIKIKPTGKKQLARIKPQEQEVLCSQCKSEHCPHCYRLSHLTFVCRKNSFQEKQEEMMNKLNYRRCPKCEIWVQKKGGCQYLNCKCGCEFCYKCGVTFLQDPCRKRVNGKMIDDQVMQALRELSFRKPETVIGKLLLPFRLLFLLIIFLIFNCIPFLALILLIGLATPLIVIVAPGFLIFVYSEMPLSTNWVIFLRIMTLLLYPVVGVILGIFFILIVVTYPLMRLIIPSRLYDSFDQKIARLSILYLKILNTLFDI